MIDTIKIVVLIVLFVSMVLPVIVKFGNLFVGLFTYLPSFAANFIVIAFVILLIKVVRDWISD